MTDWLNTEIFLDTEIVFINKEFGTLVVLTIIEIYEDSLVYHYLRDYYEVLDLL